MSALQFGCVDLSGLGDGVLQWRDDGFFRSERGDGVTVRGVGSDAEAVAELLRRADVLDVDRPVHWARPAHEVVDFGWSSEASFDASDELRVDVTCRLDEGRPADLEHRLQVAARRVPTGRADRDAMAQAAAAALNVAAPQVGSHRLFMPPFDDSDVGALGVERSATRGWATWVQWVTPSLLTSTNAEVWGDIDRHPRRDTVVRVAEWLADAVAEDALDGWLERMFVREPMLLNRVEGPAGPVYEVLTGTHRAHAARIWELPWVLARVQVERLARPLRPRTDSMEALWTGLSRRGLMTARRDGDLWYVGDAPAEWMLTPPAMAVQWNTMYERVYPGALQAFTGMAAADLFDANRWAAALLN